MGDVGGSGDERTHAIGWFTVVVFAYYYKAVLVGFLGGVLGYKWLGGTLIHGISTNHWIEIIIYCPLLWLALHQINDNVFDIEHSTPLGRRAVARRRLIGEFAIAIVIYGTGVHIANVIEIYSREQRGIEEGDVYNLVYFIDEGFSHYLQFVPLFFVIGWFVINDRPRLGLHPTFALFLGAGHGVERTVGIIEGGKWFLGPPTVVWLASAAWIRSRRLRRLGVNARDDFFFRYAFSFCVTLPIAQLAYLGRVGSFAQPSRLADSGGRLIGMGVIVLTVLATCALSASERWWNPHGRRAVTAGLARSPHPDPSTSALAADGQSVTTPSSSAALAGSMSGALHQA
jgi:hypothetical protein